jgi:hypothetical protein
LSQLTSTTSAPLQLEGVNGKVPKQTEQSSPFAKRTGMQPMKKKKSGFKQTMGQRMLGTSKKDSY